MKKDILSANPYIPVEHGVGVSLKLFIDFIEARIRTEKSNRKYFYKYILEKFQQHPELYNETSIDKIGDYEDILQLIAYSVIPMLEDENEVLWAFGKTFSPHFFYGSDAFYKLLHQINESSINDTKFDKEESMRIHKELQYSFILEKKYGIKTFSNKEWIHRVIDSKTGLYQYYRLTIDRRFAWLETKGEIPDFDCCTLEKNTNSNETIKILQRQLPVGLFEGKGFTIMSLTDVTAHHAVEQLSKIPVDEDETKGAVFMQHTNRLLQTIIGNNAYHFGIMPFLAINQRAAVLYERFLFSTVADTCWKANVSTELFTKFVKELQAYPGIQTYDENITNDFFPEEIQDAFKKGGIKLYKCFPVHYNNQLVGILEISSKEENLQPAEEQLASLQTAVFFIGRLLQQIINKFNLRIENIVKDKFTNIQPSVQWKFNEVAWHYLRSNFFANKTETIENVSFENVFPLYGAVDIRNSTIERNNALKQDIKTQLELLIQTFESIDDPSYTDQIETIIRKCNSLLQQSSISFNVNDEIELDNFLLKEVHPLLEMLNSRSAHAAEQIQSYYLSTNKQTGVAFEKRRQIEVSMRLINNTINNFYDEAREGLQNIYPCYFDKFRTDGVEYDIYTGQSIAPKTAFEKQHLQKFRLWQLQSMAAIAQLTHSLLPQMPHALETTQLLFVHSEPIDISFRNDERRFDVEGAYNIRYQVIKKRIDKVHIRNTQERLTQPGKIAIVYFNEKEADEYVEYIKELQSQHVLQTGIEFLELEELQGVSGLKALRVDVYRN